MATTTRTALNGAWSTQRASSSPTLRRLNYVSNVRRDSLRHTGDSSTGGSTNNSYVEYFIDDIYMGRNNVFVPTRGSRLWISLWPTGDAKYVS